MQLYFIGGASGSGKTAILEKLKKLDPSFNIYDFDDIGVPKDADAKWRQSATNQWLQRLLQENHNACLLGQIVLGEILACPLAKNLGKFTFILLDVDDNERIERLKARGDTPNQDMLNWASWLRTHHRNPQWAQHVLKENSWEEMNFSNWDNNQTWHDTIVHEVNTTHLSIDETANIVHDILLKPPLSVIFLTGPTSAGKTSLACALQDALPTTYLHIGIDRLCATMPSKINDWLGESNKPMPGFWWKVGNDPDGNTTATIQLGPEAHKIDSLLKHFSLAALQHNFNLIIDEVCISKASLDNWKAVLKPFNTIYIGLKADTETLENRINERKDRIPGSARTQNNSDINDDQFDLVLNSEKHSTKELVKEVLHFLED